MDTNIPTKRKSRKRIVGGLLDSKEPLCCTEEFAKTAAISIRAAELFAASGQVRCVRVGRQWRLNRADCISYLGLSDSEG